MGNYIYYCPYCGQRLLKIAGTCSKCNARIKPVQSKYEISYYIEKAVKKYKDDFRWYECLLPEIKENPLFDEKKFNIEADYEGNYRKYAEPLDSTPDKKQHNIPKCPTCGSTNIKKISSTSKVVGAATFGLFSKTARSQFECKNCGYKW